MTEQTAHKFHPDKAVDADGPTNAMRADRAAIAIDAFLDATGEAGGADDESIRDLIADLFHLCDREGLDVVAITPQSRQLPPARPQ